MTSRKRKKERSCENLKIKLRFNDAVTPEEEDAIWEEVFDILRVFDEELTINN